MKKLVSCLFGLIMLTLFCCSCSVHHQTEITGRTRVIVVDTTYIHHGGNISIPRVKH